MFQNLSKWLQSLSTLPQAVLGWFRSTPPPETGSLLPPGPDESATPPCVSCGHLLQKHALFVVVSKVMYQCLHVGLASIVVQFQYKNQIQ